MTTKTKRVYEKLGYSMWKTKGKGDWYYITALLLPPKVLEALYHACDGCSNVTWEEAPFILICSCKDFTIGIASREGNPLVNPCKHIRDFDESEVEIEKLECGSEG